MSTISTSETKNQELFGMQRLDSDRSKVKRLAIYAACSLVTSGYGVCVVLFYALPRAAQMIPLEAIGQALYQLLGLAVLTIPILSLIAAVLTVFKSGRRTGITMFKSVLVISAGTFLSLFVSLEAGQIGEIRVMTNGARVITKLEEFRRDQGKYPDYLNALVPKYMEVIPTAGYFGALDKYFRIEKAGNGPDEYLLSVDTRIFERLEYYSDPDLRNDLLKTGYHYRPVACGWILNFDAD